MAVLVIMVIMMMNIHLEAQDKRLNDSSTDPARVMAKHDEVDAGGKSVKKCQKVKKTSKAWKVAKIIGLEERLPKHRSSGN